MTVLLVPGTPGTTLYAGLPTPSGGLITTLSLVNTSGSTQAANFVSPMLGVPFKAGDLPSGEYPVFALEDDTPCPATIWDVTTWPDGSMKRCSAIFRVPASIAGSGTLTINVNGGGSAPSASSRGTSDFTAADLKTELTGVTNLSGVWTASLNTAITDATDVVVLGDGPAGKVYKIGGPLKQSGSAHGQMHAWHYAVAMQNNVGGLLGLRYLGRLVQPWADVASPTPTRRVVTGVLKSGATTLRTFSGHDTTETPGSNIGFNHYASFWTCGTDGKYDFVQGGGSDSADCTVRVVFDKSDFVRSRMVDAYDLTVTPTSAASVDYRPGGKGSVNDRDLDGTGTPGFIGILPEWCVVHLMTQAAVDERAVRVNALISSAFRVTVLRSTTGQIIPVADVDASYTGLGTIQTTWRYGIGIHTGVQTPTDTTTLWSGDTNTSHKGSFHYYAYLITGEPQYLDMMKEAAAQNMMLTAPGTLIRATGDNLTALRVGAYAGFRDVQVGSGGTIYKGAGVLYTDGGVRIGAWACRDIAQLVAVLPDAPPDGANVKGYFTDVLNSAFSSINDLNSQLPTSWQNSGLFSTNANTATTLTTDAGLESPWMIHYMHHTACCASRITGLSSAETFRAHLANFISSADAQMDIGCITSYRMNTWRADGTLVDDIADVLFQMSVTLTFNAAANTGTVSGALGTWTPANGTKMAFSTLTGHANKPFPEATNGAIFHMVNCSGQTFQLAATPGGSAIDVPTDIVVTTCFIQLQSISPLNDIEGIGEDYYLGLAHAAASAHLAIGDTSVSAARTQLAANVVSEGIDLVSDPRSAMAAAYPV